ncbi:MAG: inositol monophosphatase family protein [Myxococcaceae bacterium]
MSEPRELARLAEAIARAAGRVLADKFKQARSISFKGERHTDLVTDADGASEAVVLDWLRREVPTHGVLAEESGAVRTGEYTWYVDPLDGTTNYAHAVPHFCVTLGVDGPGDGGRAMLAGVVFDPLRDELFLASRGGGATLNGEPIRCSPATALRQALMCTGFPYDVTQAPNEPLSPAILGAPAPAPAAPPRSADLALGLFTRIVRRAQGIRRMGSAALDLSYVACGRYDGYFEFGLKPWDTAAGALLVREAGGAMHAIDGAAWEPECLDVLACAPGLEGELSQTCRDFVEQIGWKPRRFSAR